MSSPFLDNIMRKSIVTRSDPIFVFESQHGWKVVAATGHHQGGRDDHYIVLKDGLTLEDACDLAKRLRDLLA